MGRVEPTVAPLTPCPPPPPSPTPPRRAPAPASSPRGKAARAPLLLACVLGVTLGVVPGVAGGGAGWVRPAAGADDPEAVALRRRLADDDPAARAAAVRRLAGEPLEGSFSLVLKALADPHPYVRGAAAGVLGIQLERAPRDPVHRRSKYLGSLVGVP